MLVNLIFLLTGFVDSHDVDEEFYLQFQIVDENLSHYLDDNIREFLEVDPDSFDKDDDEFVESNQMKGESNKITLVLTSA